MEGAGGRAGGRDRLERGCLGMACPSTAHMRETGPWRRTRRTLFENLDKAEELLGRQRFLVGDRFTEADLRLFVTLIRFDEVYVVSTERGAKW